jgi:hypothetical protein
MLLCFLAHSSLLEVDNILRKIKIELKKRKKNL